jgi:hypothetical protein
MVLDAGCVMAIWSRFGVGQKREQTSQTRLNLARRVLTGGWGWNTSVSWAGSGGSADAFVRPDGIMDQYKVRWGVMYYDGLGARMVLNPTVDGPGKIAQKAVIDFGNPGFGENYGNPGLRITDNPRTIGDGNDTAGPPDTLYAPRFISAPLPAALSAPLLSAPFSARRWRVAGSPRRCRS